MVFGLLRKPIHHPLIQYICSSKLRKHPMKMGTETLENLIMEKYLGDIIHEKDAKKASELQ